MLRNKHKSRSGRNRFPSWKRKEKSRERTRRTIFSGWKRQHNRERRWRKERKRKEEKRTEIFLVFYNREERGKERKNCEGNVEPDEYQGDKKRSQIAAVCQLRQGQIYHMRATKIIYRGKINKLTKNIYFQQIIRA